VNTYNTAYKELEKIDKDVLKITGETADIKAAEIQGPEKDEPNT
ncbi:MAG: DNA recombination protein RmuC, partial [Parcubacteria group bacterium]|nr:DNA recombination protein RmuC [Parcubacteria group bacterium]